MVQYTGRRRRHTPKEFVPRATKHLFKKDNAWEKVLWKHAQTFSLWQITCVERMLSYCQMWCMEDHAVAC
ncbi:hypothetical protein CGK40_25890, partial [Vibrio parahaemolyticus]